MLAVDDELLTDFGVELLLRFELGVVQLGEGEHADAFNGAIGALLPMRVEADGDFDVAVFSDAFEEMQAFVFPIVEGDFAHGFDFEVVFGVCDVEVQVVNDAVGQFAVEVAVGMHRQRCSSEQDGFVLLEQPVAHQHLGLELALPPYSLPSRLDLRLRQRANTQTLRNLHLTSNSNTQLIPSYNLIDPIHFRLTYISMAVQQKMSKDVVREPIHPRTGNRGRLRKIEHHRSPAHPASQHLLLTPTLVLPQEERRQKVHYFLRQRHRIDANLPFFNPENENSTGSFRAIHTALPDQCIRGFPLRSVTPIKPFRRGIRAHTPAQTLVPDSPKTARPHNNTHQKHLSEILIGHPPSLMENQEHEEFYKYKEGKEGEGRRLAGCKIEPFKKYHIREVLRGALSQKLRPQ